MKRAVFIVGSGRSGTTAMVRLLSQSAHAVCRSEPAPNLNAESRLMWDGYLSNPHAALIEHVLPRMAKAFLAADVYVEKQVSLVPFMRHLHELTGCRFIVMTRPGPEVVRSILGWHENVLPVFYREAGGGTAAADLPDDPFDQSLPRPAPDEEYGAGWGLLDRTSMASYYWNRVNLELLEQMRQLPEDAVMRVDLNGLSPEKISEVYDFCGLPDFDRYKVAALLDRRVNSVADRLGDEGKVKVDWDAEWDRKFGEFGSVAMRELGYWPPLHAKIKPEGYGKYWIEEKTDVAWFEEIYEYRRPLHELFKKWFLEMDKAFGIGSMIDLGFGIGHGYLDFFEGKEFTGVDINPNNIKYCEEHEKGSGRRFLCEDMVENPLDEKFDLVFSHSTIDNVHDPEVFLRNACRMAGKFLYFSSYRGWFPRFRQHQITWDPKNRVYFNDVSPREIARVLREEGFEHFAIIPQKSYRDDIAAETIIVASREAVDRAQLLAGHEPQQTYEKYSAETDSSSPLADVCAQVNRSCHYFSTAEGGMVTDSLVDFDKVMASVASKPNLTVGRVADLACGEGGVNFAVRLDVDMDLVCAAEMAWLGICRQVPLSFYILHTAAYYGRRKNGVFRRNVAPVEIYRFIQSHGHEIGLHADALTIYRDWGQDGAEAIRAELDWLRGEGIKIEGTAAHNCAPVYGAENFEIFRNRVIGERDHTVSDWSYLPLGVLDEEELGLRYEANSATASDRVGTESQRRYLGGLPRADFNRNRSWMRTYLLDNPHNRWGYHFRIWHLGAGFWVIAGRDEMGVEHFEHGVDFDRVDKFLSGIKATETAVMVLHPIYFGHRIAPGSPPLYSNVTNSDAKSGLRRFFGRAVRWTGNWMVRKGGKILKVKPKLG